MITGIKHRSVVGKDGKIEIDASELAEGTKVEIIVLVEDPASMELDHDRSDDETAYLLSTPANRTKLLQAIENSQDSNHLVVISPEEWHEKYHL